MKIRKRVIQVTFLYDDEVHAPDEWPLRVIGNEIDDGDCIGTIETVSDDPLTNDQVRQAEIEMGGDGGFMLVGHEDQEG